MDNHTKTFIASIILFTAGIIAGIQITNSVIKDFSYNHSFTTNFFSEKYGIAAVGNADVPIKNITHNTTPAVSAVADKINNRSNRVSVFEGLSKGKAGTTVSSLQFVLRAAGFFPSGAEIVDNFGKTTEAAVKSFQKSRGLTPSGVVDKQTAAALSGLFSSNNNDGNNSGGGGEAQGSSLPGQPRITTPPRSTHLGDTLTFHQSSSSLFHDGCDFGAYHYPDTQVSAPGGLYTHRENSSFEGGGRQISHQSSSNYHTFPSAGFDDLGIPYGDMPICPERIPNHEL